MNLVSVTSSNLRAIGYDVSTQTLTISFIKSGVYEFYKIPDSTHSALMNAYSKGTYFDRNIKGRFQYKKIANY
jgi:hypothetical protein